MFSCLYNSVMWSMLISVCLFQNTWLEMRVNLGWIFFGLTVLLSLLQIFVKSIRKICGTFTASTLSLIVSCLGLWLILGTERLKIIPASIIREGIMQNRLSFSTINTVLIAIAVIGWILTFILRENER